MESVLVEIAGHLVEMGVLLLYEMELLTWCDSVGHWLR